VWEIAVVARRRNHGESRETTLDVGAVKGQEARPIERLEGGADPSGYGGRRALDLDAADREHRRQARKRIEADRADDDREAHEERAP
jgi:hypothetical protein